MSDYRLSDSDEWHDRLASLNTNDAELALCKEGVAVACRKYMACLQRRGVSAVLTVTIDPAAADHILQ
jgi:hypothetical protein